MPLLAVGVDHRQTPTKVAERLVAGASDLYDLASDLIGNGLADEVVVLGTCLRSEIYALSEHPAKLVDRVEAGLPGIEAGNVSLGFAVDGDEVAEHLFRVAAGLQSTVLGEAEILGQVARAWEVSRSKGLCGQHLDALFRHAIAAGKRARRETLISHGVTSIAHAAVVMAKKRVLDLTDKRVLIIGAGDMSERMATAAVRSAKLSDVVVANRTWERGHALAQKIGGKAIDFDGIGQALIEADVVFSSTGSAEPVIPLDMAEKAGSTLIVDFAVPRDTQAGVEDLPNVDVLLMHDLQEFARAGVDARAGEARSVEAIVDEEIQRYFTNETEREMVPTISQLRAYAETIRTQELERYGRRFQHLDESERQAVDALTKSLINKLLHQPTMRLKQSAGSPEGEQLSELLRVLFPS